MAGPVIRNEDDAREFARELNGKPKAPPKEMVNPETGEVSVSPLPSDVVAARTTVKKAAEILADAVDAKKAAQEAYNIAVEGLTAAIDRHMGPEGTLFEKEGGDAK